MGFKQLRDKHPEFIYQGFEITKVGQGLKIFFDFEISPNLKFKPEIFFPSVPQGLNKNILNNLVFNLGMVELISYWKATCSPQIIIKAGDLNEDQIAFWKNLLIKGLGEFFYTNKIDFTQNGLVNFEVRSHMLSGKPFDGTLKDRDLILVGGGKDSAVTLDSISKSGKEFNCLLLNPTDAAIKIAKIGGCENPIIIKRTMDPKLLDLNKQGYLNGHTPFSAYLAFLAALSGVIYDYKNIVVSNEASSSEGNLEYHGQIINHQYSKSLEFEQNFRDYCKKYLSSQTDYHSFLRKLNELEITRQFAKLEKYHRVFRSCNKGSKQGIWCGQCSKCLFSYLILYPFLGGKLKIIFGRDLLDDESLAPLMEQLLQLPGKFKPFECVGTKEEIQYALLLSILKLDSKNLPKLLEKFKTKLSILILGMGREGQVTLKFLKKYLPENLIGTSDQNEGKNYLDKMKDYDIIIKSPGIPFLPEIKKAKEQGKIITSATSIFFDVAKGKIIGVTGTKGKSTTASLIYEVLKNGSLNVYLVGNIGQPALDLLDKIKKDSIVVYELSSFQLEDLNKSPHIAVITNIYPEHLDHHGSLDHYIDAKANIIRFQKKDDFVIFNKGSEEALKIVQASRAKNKIGYSAQLPINTKPAEIIGKIFNISEDKIKQAIKNFKTLPHRLEFVGEFKGIKFYNDSLSTIPQATIRALDILGKNVETLIAGGFDRGLDYSILAPAIANSKIKNLILFPTTGTKIWNAICKVGPCKAKKYEVSSMEEAVKLAYEHTATGKIVLLSPASTSFNLFNDYEDRGNQFKDWIKKLGN